MENSLSGTTLDNEICHCGRVLHYYDPQVEATMRRLVKSHGAFMPITVGNRTFLVQRHYVALHGVQGANLPELGFEEVI